MTRNKKHKTQVRAFAAEKGVSYQAALAMLQSASAGGQATNRTAAILSSVQTACDNLANVSINDVFSTELIQVWEETAGASSLSQPEVIDVIVDGSTLTTDVAEVFDGDTVALSGSCTADVWVDGLMSKGDAFGWAESNVVVINDDDFTRHDAAVTLQNAVQVQLEFGAIVSGDVVESFDFYGAGTLV